MMERTLTSFEDRYPHLGTHYVPENKNVEEMNAETQLTNLKNLCCTAKYKCWILVFFGMISLLQFTFLIIDNAIQGHTPNNFFLNLTTDIFGHMISPRFNTSKIE